ncbi:hypothetical protein D3871_00395 [Noviherbaspirillum saxi]|uniref:Uncharacterized protein n=1 Tax=Noviherbaspirillum saxi TaxID=2320863 RepID=A0A3A3FSJ0_9BURK|nr:hypothetical protein D3871_00395 [Noviherbaspirillum saxi]
MIAEGALHRAELLLAKDTVRTGLRPVSLARSAVQQLTATASTSLRNRGVGSVLGTDSNLHALLPLLMSGLSALAEKKSLRKAMLGATLLLGAAGIAAAAMARRNGSAHSDQDR